MRIIIPSFCLVFALQIQASCFSRILSKLWPPRLSHGGPISGTSSPVQKDTAAESNKETSPVTSGAVDTEPWTHTGYEPITDDIRPGLLLRKHSLDEHSRVEMIPRHCEMPNGSNQLPIEERSEIYRGSGSDMGSTIYMGYVTASHPGYVGYVGLRKAIDEGRLDIAVDLVKQDEELGEVGVKYVIRKHNDPDLIASFVNQTNQANASTLDELGRESSIETSKKVLEKVVFPQQALVDLASSYASYPETFLVLLNKIVKPEDQEKAVEKGIEKLVYMPIATSRLLNALKGKTFRSERLEYIAIQKAFMEGVKSGRVDHLPTDICNHAAITPELYADALIVTAGLGKYNPMRKFLLKQADRYDLEAVKEKAGYADLKADFRGAIEEALKTAAPGGTRTRAYDIQTVEKAERNL